MAKLVQSIIPNELADLIEERAKSENRSVSNYIQTILKEMLTKEE